MGGENSRRLGNAQTRQNTLSSQIAQYGVAIASVALALGITLAFNTYLAPTPTPLFFAAVMMSAWYGGLEPGIAATVLSTLAINYFLVEPIYELSVPDLGTFVRLGVFVMAALFINSLNETQRTARRKAEANFKSLQASEARFGCLAESNIIGTLVAELDGAILDANQKFLQIVGYSQEELRTGQLHWRTMTSPESLEVSERAVKQLLTTGACTPFEKEYLRKDGSRVPVLHGAVMTGDATVTGFVLDLSERKQVAAIQQEAMRRERSLLAEVQTVNTQLETVLASIDDQFLVLDQQWRYVYVSDRVVEVVGRSREELMGRCIWDLFPDIVGSEFYIELHRAVAEQRIIQFETFYAPWQRWFENRVYPSNTGVSVLVTDITERKQAEEDLQRTNQTLQTLLDFCPVAIAFFDPQGTVKLWNRAAERIFGWSAEEAIGKFMPTVAHRQAEFLASLQTVLNGQSLNGFEAQHQRKDGQRVDLEIWANLTHDAEGNPGCLGIALDITERKQAEAALRHSEDRFQVLVSNMPGMVYRYAPCANDKATFTYVSSGSRALVELEPEAILQDANAFLGLIHPDDKPSFQNSIAVAVQNSTAWLWEGRLITLSGQHKWIQGRSRPQYTEQGEVWDGIFFDITDRKQAEEALRDSQMLYQMLAEALPSLVWTVLPDGTLDFANQQWRDALGITVEQVNQGGWELIVHPDDMPHILQDWAEVQAGATVTVREYRHRMADGTYRWFLARMMMIRDERGQLIRLIGVSTDIDDRKRMEDALRSSEERLALASQAANVGTFEWNIQTNELFWTAEEEALYGFPPGGFAGQFEHWKQAVHPNDRAQAERDVLQAVENRTDLNNEFRIIRPDGSVRWLAAKGRVYYDAEDNPLRMVGMNEDITDRKQLEMEREQLLQQLENSLGQFEAVVNSMTEGLLVSDAQGNVLLFNPAALALHEYDSVEQVRRHLHEFPDTFEGHDLQGNFISLERWPLARVLQGETYRNYEINVHRLDTNTRWIGNFSGTPVYDKQGNMVLAIVTMHDITNRKRAEAERLQLLEQEREAREQAEAANRIKDEFLAVLSHELRTPLNPILGWSRLLRQGRLDTSRANAALETIERNAKLQIQLIDDLLDISRILQGKLSLKSVPVDLNTTIAAAIETVQLAAEAKSIHIQTQFECEGITVLGDSGRLQQVVWNLLTNAVKFTPETGQIQIRLSTTGTRAQIQVTDTGKGIRPEFLPYVFDTFRQADSTTTRTFGGLGLGLAIVRHLVELHGGRVKAESPGEGQGATFTVTLPLMPILPPIPQEVAPMSDSLNFQGVHVLVVDDEADNLELVQFILEQAGATVISASLATEALEKIPQLKPHLIVADIGMPGMDGYAMIQQVRRLPPEQGGQLPAIALTAYASEVNQQQALAAGFQRHLSKPVDPEALMQAIAELLHQS